MITSKLVVINDTVTKSSFIFSVSTAKFITHIFLYTSLYAVLSHGIYKPRVINMKEDVAFNVMLRCTRTAVIKILYISTEIISLMRQSYVNTTCV